MIRKCKAIFSKFGAVVAAFALVFSMQGTAFASSSFGGDVSADEHTSEGQTGDVASIATDVDILVPGENDALPHIAAQSDDIAGSLDVVEAALNGEPLTVQVVGGASPYTYAWSRTVDGTVDNSFADEGSISWNVGANITHEMAFPGELEDGHEYVYNLKVVDGNGVEVQTDQGIRIIVSSDYAWIDGWPDWSEDYGNARYYYKAETGEELKVAGWFHKDTHLVVTPLEEYDPFYQKFMLSAKGQAVMGSWVFSVAMDEGADETAEPFIGKLNVSVRLPGESASQARNAGEIEAYAAVDGVRAGTRVLPSSVLFMRSYNDTPQDASSATSGDGQWMSFCTDNVGSLAALGAVPGASGSGGSGGGGGGSVAHTVTVNVGEHGSALLPNGVSAVSVPDGATITLTALAESGYKVAAAATNDVPVKSGENTVVLGPVDSDCVLDISFEKVDYNPGIAYTVRAEVDGGHGTVQVQGGTIGSTSQASAAKGSSLTVYIYPESAKYTARATVNGLPAAIFNDKLTISAVDGDKVVSVKFVEGLSSNPEDQTIDITVGKGGKVIGSPTVPFGETASFEMVPNENYELNKVLVDGEEVSISGLAVRNYGNYVYTFPLVTSSHTLAVTFKWTSLGPEPGSGGDPTGGNPGGNPGANPGGGTGVSGGDNNPPHTPSGEPIVGPGGQPVGKDDNGNLLDTDGNVIPTDRNGNPTAPDGTVLPVGPDGKVHADPNDPLYGKDASGKQVVVNPKTKFTVKIAASGEGSVWVVDDANKTYTVSGSREIEVGAYKNLSLVFMPKDGWYLDSCKVDGKRIGAGRSYDLNNILASHQVEVAFKQSASSVAAGTNSGTDVKRPDYIGTALSKTGDAVVHIALPIVGIAAVALTVMLFAKRRKSE